uniref:Kazal-like domain-containing protein n=1 Tax=Xenopus tropicalis TaxID=8364 RepID=A0A6I8QTF9_XENTR
MALCSSNPAQGKPPIGLNGTLQLQPGPRKVSHRAQCIYQKLDDDGGLACTKEINPLCGTDGVSYDNPCMLYDYTMCGNDYKPVCGTDGESYDNECWLCIDCSRYTEFCTFIYKPYCGSNGMSYSNKCSYCIAQNKWGTAGICFLYHHS